MAQLDDSVGAHPSSIWKISVKRNTIVIFSTDNGAEVFTWPYGGMTPFKATKGTVLRVNSVRPASFVGPDMSNPGTVENGLFSGPRLVPDADGRRARQPGDHR